MLIHDGFTTEENRDIFQGFQENKTGFLWSLNHFKRFK